MKPEKEKTMLVKSILLNEKRLDELKEKARKEELDFYTLVASEENEVKYEEVTTSQRSIVKNWLFAYTYGQKL